MLTVVFVFGSLMIAQWLGGDVRSFPAGLGIGGARRGSGRAAHSRQREQTFGFTYDAKPEQIVAMVEEIRTIVQSEEEVDSISVAHKGAAAI